MLKAESCGDQRVRNLLYGQSVWVPAYCVLDEGIISCYKDRAHTHCVEAFDLAETRVEVSDRTRHILAFNCETDHGHVVIDMMARDADEATAWVRAAQAGRRWAEWNKRNRLGLAPLNPAAMKLVGARKLAKKHEICLKCACFLAWLDSVCAVAARLPTLNASPPDFAAATPRRPGEPPVVRDRVKEAFLPGQQRRIRNVNGRVTVFRPRPPDEIVRQRRDEEAEAAAAAAAAAAAGGGRAGPARRSAEEPRVMPEEARRRAAAQDSLRRRASDGHARTFAELQDDLVDMVRVRPSPYVRVHMVSF